MSAKSLPENDDYRCSLNQYPKHLECPICLLLMKDPQIVSCCGKKFCASCIQRIPSENCPICKQEFTSMLEKELQRQILNLETKCSQEGCNWTGEVRQFENHMENGCQHCEVDCSLHCGVKLKRKDLHHHQLHQCSKRSLLDVQLASITSKLEERVIALEEVCARQSQEIIQLKQELKSVQTNDILPRFSLTTSPTNVYWYSPRFYSHQQGYTLRFKCTTINPGWMGQYQVHCQLQLLHGEHDDMLRWPIDIEAVVEVSGRHHQLVDEGRLFTFILKNVEKPNARKHQISESQKECFMSKFQVIVGVAFYFADIKVVSVECRPILHA